jgi:leucyl-tRNA synthetase
VEALAKANPNVQRFIQDATIKKVIVIPQKLVNIVAQ